MNNKSKIILEILLLNTFILSLFISQISNYSVTSFILKALSNVILHILIYLDIQVKKDFFHNEGFNPFKNLPYTLFLIPILFISLTLTYSLNPLFGILKLANLFISVIPLIIASYYLLKTNTEQRFTILIYSLLTVAIATTIFVIIVRPFDYSTIYKFSILRWSHVIYGRFTGLVFLLSIYLLYERRNIFRPTLVTIIAAIILVGIYLSGLRAAFIGVLLITTILLTIGLIKRKIPIGNVLLLIFISISIILIINSFDTTTGVSKRYNESFTITNEKVEFDASWQVRIDAAEISWEMFKEHPILGSGLGGFNRNYNSSLPQAIKYPHNIFLEVMVEFGIVGMLGFVYLLWTMFRAARRLSVFWIMYLVYAFWLALFAKDISTNTLLWLAVVFMSNSQWHTDYTD